MLSEVFKDKMNQDKYIRPKSKEGRAYQSATAVPSDVRRVQLKGFPVGELFTMLHPDYKSFREFSIKQSN